MFCVEWLYHIISMSIHVHDCPIFSGSPAAPSHNTRPSETHMRYLHATDLHIARKTPLRPQSLRRNRPITEKSLLNQNPSDLRSCIKITLMYLRCSPVHILGSLQRSYPAPPGICHTGTTHLMLKDMLGRRCEKNRWKWLRMYNMYNLTLLEVFWKM